MKNNEIVESLNDLLTKAYDAEQGYAKAAERAEEHPQLCHFFREQSANRLAFGHDIKGLITRYGGEPDKGSSVAAKAHQVWITVKDTLTGDQDAEAVLEECIRGEKNAVAEYDKQLETEGLPADVISLITDQRAKVLQSLSIVRAEEELAD